jgi:hypothetical protein
VIKDQLTVWSGQFPYDALAPAGITPQSSQAEVEDASFALMTKRMMNSTTQKAWDELRDPQRRLLVDMLLYNVDPAEEIGRARARLERELADTGEPPELAEALTVPAELLHELAAELTTVHLEPPGPVAAPKELGPFPSPSLIDSLIQFDR